MIFEIKPEHLECLDPNKSVDLIRKLIWADAYVSGIPITQVNVPTRITISDGGIDAEVQGVQNDGKCGIIKKGITSYQIKSGKFDSIDSGIKDILCKKKSVDLKDRIKSCFDAQGTLVVVFTGWDNPDRSDDQIKNKFKEKLIDISDRYKTAKIEIWRPNQIIGFLENLPSLRLDVLGITDGSFYFHEEWSKLSDMKPKIYSDDEHLKFIKNFRKQLRVNDKPVHIRIIGEPGIGKTRLVLEATKTDDLLPCTIYVEDPTKLEERDFINEVSRTDNESNLILVVDECNFDEQTLIWNRLKSKSPKIKLVTIFNEPDDSSGTTTRMDMPELSDEKIGEIIKEYGIDESEISKWVEWTRPYPRAARMIGNNLRENPEDILRPPDTVSVWDRCIASRLSFNSEDFKNRKMVLLWLSLFKKFGFEPPFDFEWEMIASLIKTHEGIPTGTLTRTVKKLKKMKILQGSSTLYITPKILHVYLWTQWWEQYNTRMAFDVLKSISQGEVSDNTQNLVSGYSMMFEYAKQSPQASAVSTKLLEREDFFASGQAGLFLTLSKTDPSSALDYLERKICGKSRDQLLQFTSGRRETVWALEIIAEYKENFERATNLLLLLAEAENEDFSNNATGVFLNLFSPAAGRVASTEVAPKDRIPVLESAINSDSKLKRSIAIKACNEALQMGYFSRVIPDYGEIGTPPQLWKPKSEEEIIDYYQAILNILVMQLNKHEEDRNEVVDIILHRLRSFACVPKLAEKILEIVRKLHEMHWADSEKLLKTIGSVIYSTKNLQPKILEEMQRLQNDITGNDFHSLMKRYVGMDIQMDWLGETKSNQARVKEIDDLTTLSLDLSNLEPELNWLVTKKAKYGYRFGYELGKKDAGNLLLPSILNALRNAGNEGSGFFVGGYLSSIYEKDTEKWESELEKIYNDSALCQFLPEITWRSGMSDRAAERFISGIHENKFDYTCLGLFKYGSVFLDRLSEESFTTWILLLLEEKKEDAVVIAVDLFYSYYVQGQQTSLPKQLTLKLLLHENIIHRTHEADYAILDEFIWKQIGLTFVKQYPEDSVEIAKTVLENFGAENFFGHHDYEVTEVLDEIARIKPKETWKIASQYVGPPIDSRAYNVQQWLKKELFSSDIGALPTIPMSEIIAWTDEDEKSRAGYIASFLPPEFEKIREFLVKYGDQEEVKRRLAMNFDTEGWRGSAITHYEKKKKKFEELEEKETNVNVKSWLNFYIRLLDRDIERSIEREERELY